MGGDLGIVAADRQAVVLRRCSGYER